MVWNWEHQNAYGSHLILMLLLGVVSTGSEKACKDNRHCWKGTAHTYLREFTGKITSMWLLELLSHKIRAYIYKQILEHWIHISIFQCTSLHLEYTRWRFLQAEIVIFFKNILSVGNLILLLLSEQPAAEIIAFRIGELRGLSRWRARLRRVGLHESLMECAMEDSGMLLVQVERLLRIVSETTGQVFHHC